MKALDCFVSLDFEIACRRPLTVCAVGAVRVEHGQETRVYTSRVRYLGRVKYTAIHGLTRSDLRDAPDWPAVWRAMQPVFANIRQVVAYRASFDRAALLTMAAHHGIRLPSLHFVCAAEMYQKVTGQRPSSLASALKAHGLRFPGTPHDPLADARAAAALVHRLTAVQCEERRTLFSCQRT